MTTMMSIRQCARARNQLSAAESNLFRTTRKRCRPGNMGRLHSLMTEKAQQQHHHDFAAEKVATASLIAAAGVTTYSWLNSNEVTRLEEAEITTGPQSRRVFGTTAGILSSQKPSRASKACSFQPKSLAPEDRYDIDWSNLLGRGSFGSVHLAVDALTGERVALKRIDRRSTDAEALNQEIDVLEAIRDLGGHKNIVRFRDFYQDDDYYYVVLDLVKGGELYDDLLRNGQYSDEEAAILMQQLGSALSFLHSNGVAHGDLKPENILMVDPSGRRKSINSKLIDFGCASTTDSMEATHQSHAAAAKEDTASGGTFAYWPPERFSEDSSTNTPETDMWSLGIILYILLVGRHPFDPTGDATDDEIRESIRSCQQVELPSDLLSKEAEHVLSRLLQVDPKQRMTADELQRHSWVANN